MAGSVIAIAACGGGAKTPPADTQTAATTQTAGTATLAVPFYELVGHHAENAYDYVKTADWVAARASVDSLTAVVRASQPRDTAGSGTDLRESLARLDSAVAQRSQSQGARTANHLTAVGATLSELQNPPVPVAVTMLDYYGRELEIGAASRDNAQLSRAASGIRKTWQQIRPQVVARGGTAEAIRFDGAVAMVSAARTPTQFARTATPILDQVDALETVFTK